MKILLNGLQIGETNSGVQYYSKHIYEHLKLIDQNEFSFSLIGPSDYRLHPIKPSRIKRIYLENLIIPKRLVKNNYALYHSPNYVLPFFIKTPSVVTIHDLITLDFPELCQTESVIYFRLLLSRSIKRAKKIIAVSETVKQDILRHFNIPSEKIQVIYHGISSRFKRRIDHKVKQEFNLPDRYILFVGNIEPKKNLERLIQAFNVLKRTTDVKHKLVIAGKKGWKYKSVFETVKELGLEVQIIFIGYVPEEDLPSIYSMADLFVFPSLYEGFGIPPLEAMACGTPVIVSNKGSLPEITGGKCPQVDPYNIKSITSAMHVLLTNVKLRDQTVSGCNEWVKKFTWRQAASETYNVYKQVVRN